LNVNRLRILIEVANSGSFSAAADALSYTQSAVSQQIAALEAETGVTLIERLPRGVRLTPAGEVLLTLRRGDHRPPARRRGGDGGDRRACAAASCAWRPSRQPARR
jgi:DNA-binding transcriptional ArsR family regulator